MKAEFEATPDGIKVGNRVIGYSAAFRQLDDGKHDRNNSEGLRILACVEDAKANGWLHLTLEKEVALWRWLVVSIFINEEHAKNGSIDVPNDEGSNDHAIIYVGKNGSMGIYPGPVRFSLASHVEGCAIEKYGIETGLALALRMYQDMVEISPEHGFILSPMGREGLEMLHDEYIEMIHTEGMPDMPVTH